MVKVGVVVVLVELENLKEVVQEEMDVLDHQVAVSQNVDQVDVCHKEEIQVDNVGGSIRFLWRIVIVFIWRIIIWDQWWSRHVHKYVFFPSQKS